MGAAGAELLHGPHLDSEAKVAGGALHDVSDVGGVVSAGPDEGNTALEREASTTAAGVGRNASGPLRPVVDLVSMIENLLPGVRSVVAVGPKSVGEVSFGKVA